MGTMLLIFFLVGLGFLALLTLGALAGLVKLLLAVFGDPEPAPKEIAEALALDPAKPAG